MPVKVECESCKAPYTIDERRIPAAGLRVRCPKCTKTFVVKKPGEAGPPSSAEAAPPTQPASPSAGLDLPALPTRASGPSAGESMAKLPAQAPPSGQSAAPPSADAPSAYDDLPAPASSAGGAGLPAHVARPPIRKPVLRGTQLGLGGLAPGANPPAAPKAPEPAARGDLDLSVPDALDLPATHGDFDLPAQRGADLPATRPSADLPATRAKPSADLPATRAKPSADLPATRPSADLPAARAPRPPAVKGFGDVELPARKSTGTQEFGSKPDGSRAPAKPPAPKPSFDVELPAVRPSGPRGTPGFEDLPSVGGAALPAVSAGRDLPSPKAKNTKMEFGEVDLPSVGGNLPSVAKRGSTQKFGEIDLPEVSSGNLPSVASHLPSVASHLPSVASHLPAVASHLPDLAPQGAHLPSVAGAGHNLPAVSPHGNLPARKTPPPPPADPFAEFGAPPRGGVGDFGVAQTMMGPGYTPGQAHPEPPRVSKETSSGFGDLELPGPGGYGAAPAAEPWAGAVGGNDFGSRGGAQQRGFGEVDFGADPLGTSPRAATVDAPSIGGPSGLPTGGFGGGGGGGFGSDFGELELPGPDGGGGGMGGALGASPTASTFAGTGGAFESIAPPGDLGGGFGSPASGGFGSAPGSGFGTTPGSAFGGQPSDSRNDGGMGFGEVDLGGSSGGAPIDGDMEFGAIPQEKRTEGGDAGGAAPAPYEAPQAKTRTAEEAAADAAPKKPSHTGRYAVAVFALLLIGGASLSFTPLGPFGSLAIGDKLNAEKHSSMTSNAVKRTREGFGEDVMNRANDAVLEMQKDVGIAPRYGALISYGAYAQFAHELRFGKDPQRDSLANSALAKVKGDAPHKKLALAARDTVAGTYPAAREALKSLLGGEDGIDAAITLGELELRAKQPKEALVAFDRAVKLRDDTRAHAGLMRAYDAAGEPEKAKKEAAGIVEKNKTHVASRLLLAQYAWDRARDEKEALKWITELESALVSPGASASEKIDWTTLKGMIALERGRVTEAKNAFEEASKGGPAAGPLYGLGEVAMANGQFPLAISKFQAAATAAPDMTIAKIGVARALLRQEKATEAKATLAPLKDPQLAGEIGYWLGQAEERVNADKPNEAIKIYETAIKAQPSDVKPYIALASLQARIGKVEDADATLVQAAKNVPPSEKLHLGIGELRFRQERYPQALEHFEKALEMQPSSLEAMFSKAKTLLRMGDKKQWEDGFTALEQVKAKDKKYPGLALEYGLYFQKTEKIQEALESYKLALADAPEDVDIQLSIARAQVEARIPEAEDRLREILSKCTKSSSPDVCISETKHYLGRALLTKGQFADARTYLQQAVEKGDGNAQYHLYFGWALLEESKLADAGTEIDKTLELDKSIGAAYWLRAEIQGKKGKHKEAIEDARKALAISPSRHEAHATIAFSQKELDLEDAAIGEYRLAIKGDPTNPRAPYWRFRVADILWHKNPNSVASSAEDLRLAIKAVKANPGAKPGWFGKAHFYLGEATRHANKKEAIEAYRTWLDGSIGSTDPTRKEAKAALAELGEPYGGK